MATASEQRPWLKLRRDRVRLCTILDDLLAVAEGFPFSHTEQCILDTIAQGAQDKLQQIQHHLDLADIPLHRIENLMCKAISTVNDLDIFLIQAWEADQDEIISEAAAVVWYEDPAEVEARRPR